MEYGENLAAAIAVAEGNLDLSCGGYVGSMVRLCVLMRWMVVQRSYIYAYTRIYITYIHCPYMNGQRTKTKTNNPQRPFKEINKK